MSQSTEELLALEEEQRKKWEEQARRGRLSLYSHILEIDTLDEVKDFLHRLVEHLGIAFEVRPGNEGPLDDYR